MGFSGSPDGPSVHDSSTSCGHTEARAVFESKVEQKTAFVRQSQRIEQTLFEIEHDQMVYPYELRTNLRHSLASDNVSEIISLLSVSAKD